MAACATPPFGSSLTCCALTIYWWLTIRACCRRGFTDTAAVRGRSTFPRPIPPPRKFLHGKVEVLLTRQLSTEPNVWEALVHPGRKLGIGERIYFGADASEQSHELAAEIVARGEFGERHLRFDPVADFFAVLERIGHVPLPPYIDRPDTPLDREQYQTVYARPLGSVAAPTAGLHFTPEILDRIRARGIETAEVTLHVGLGTFQPIRVEVVEEHKIHREWYSISPEAAEKIQRARDAGRSIVAVGTTTVRTLEYAARQSPDGRITAQSGRGRHLYLSRIRLSRGRRAAHQLPSAQVHADHAGRPPSPAANAPWPRTSTRYESGIGSTRMGIACSWSNALF